MSYLIAACDIQNILVREQIPFFDLPEKGFGYFVPANHFQIHQQYACIDIIALCGEPCFLIPFVIILKRIIEINVFDAAEIVTFQICGKKLSKINTNDNITVKINAFFVLQEDLAQQKTVTGRLCYMAQTHQSIGETILHINKMYITMEIRNFYQS